MDAFLVLGTTTIDDVPLALFATEFRASEFAATVTRDDIKKALLKVFNRDNATPVGVYIIKFIDGLPVERQMVRNFEEEASV